MLYATNESSSLTSETGDALYVDKHNKTLKKEKNCEMQDAFSMVFFQRLQYMALSLCFLRRLLKCFHLHDRIREVKDGFDTIFCLKYSLLALSLCFYSHSETFFHHHDRRRELEDCFHALLLLRVTSGAVSLSEP